MKIFRNLLILFFTINFYSTDLSYKSSLFNKDTILNFEFEINKFKDSLNKVEKIDRLLKSYSLIDKNLIIENNNNLNKLYKLSTSNKIKNEVKFYDLETSGNISRGINIGNNQNSVLESELDLKIIGKLNEKVSIKASIQDSSIPIINNGYSQQLNEFDQIFIELQSEDWVLRGGDIDLIKTNSFFANYEKKIQGLLLDSYLNEKINITSAAAIVKGSFTKSILNVENGNQGPYKLTGENGELYVLIVSGSETVFVNGIKIERGIDKDYIINYNAGEIIFNSTFPIMADMRIQVEYQVSEKNYNSVFGYSNIEIIFIDDGSHDGSFSKILSLADKNKKIKVIQFFRNYGKSAALSEGFKYCSGDYVITLDADLQDDPSEIKNLISEIEKGYDLVSGWKKDRKDPLSKKIPSKLLSNGLKWKSA